MGMSEASQRTDLRHLFGSTARAHHAVYGGPNPGWPRWYAEWMYGQMLVLLDSDPNVDELEAWLIVLDARYSDEQPEGSWPGHYADWTITWDTERT
jgi:hypothetical protein